MRTVLKPLAIHAAYSPIETIVFLSIVGTLAYLHILNQIKHSAFFAPPAPLRSAYAQYTHDWDPVSYTLWRSDEKVPRLDLQQIVLTGPAPSLENATKHIAAAYSGFSHLQTAPDAWTLTVEVHGDFSLPSLPPDSWGVAYELESQGEAIAQMRSGKWVAYALRALVVRFYDLAMKTPTPDILLILTGYILMHTTFFLLISRSRALGSSFFLPLAIVSSSVLALLLALPAAMVLRIPMHPVALTEALPFLVCTVGFDKPLRLARAVFTHPRTHRPAGEVVLDALSATYFPILRDYILEIAVLLLGASSRVAGLAEVCSLAALLLALDCVMMCTFLAAIFCVMVEVRRIKDAPKPSMWSRVLGPKGTLLPARGGGGGSKGKADGPQESPVARLKLLLLVSFLAVHVLNISAPLTGPPRSPAHAQTTPVDRGLLFAVASAHLGSTDVSPEDSDEPAAPRLLVRVRPPVTLRAVRPTRFARRVEEALSAWTRLVGDPVLSKGIVGVLVISVLLNAYLIRGAARRGGVRFDDAQGEEAEEAREPVAEKPKPTPTLAPVRVDAPLRPANHALPPTPPSAVPTFSIEDVDRRLREDGWARDVAASLAPGPAAGPMPISIVHAQTPAPNAGAVQTFSIEDVNRRLRARVRSRTPARGRRDASADEEEEDEEEREPRPLEELVELLERAPKAGGLREMNDEEVVLLAQAGKIAGYALEKLLAPAQDPAGLERAVRVRRALISRASLTQTLETSDVPYEQYDYGKVLGACCENVVGYIPIPLGIAGPLNIDGVSFHIPMATAEGTLVASTSRGCKALNAGGGVTTVLTQDAMTRGPAIDFPSIVEAARAKAWIASVEGHGALKAAFEGTSRFARLTGLKTAMAGRTLFVRFATATGDAMGMNMISKGTEKALEVMQGEFPEMVVLALSGNYCTDKKPAAMNWIEGRGKSVVAEAVIPGRVVKSVLKTTVAALCNLNTKKNLVGSAMAGSIGGFNAHAANILTAIFLATGQDPAQNVVSSNCMTLMEPTNDGEDLLVTVSMPSIEVGTVGGGTVLTPQGAVLEMLGLRGAHPTRPGQNAQGLARVIAAAVMAGELSLLSALAAGHLIRAHMVHNRSAPPTPAASRPATPGPGSPVTGHLPEAPAKPLLLTPSQSTTSLPPYSRT